MKPKETSEHYILSSSPHTHANSSVRRIMLDVIIALLPTTAAGIWATAAIGLAIGSGMVLMGVLVTVFISLIQLLMHIVPVAADAYRSCNIDFLVEKSPDFQKIFEKILAEYGATIVECRITRQGDLQHYNVTVRSRKLIKADDLNKKLESCGLIREIDVLSV